ncbi:MAG: hypothetical protein R3C19_05175 [Planctomycetaceae bacterium]
MSQLSQRTQTSGSDLRCGIRSVVVFSTVLLTCLLMPTIAEAQRHGGGRGIAGGNRMSIGSTWEGSFSGSGFGNQGSGANFGGVPYQYGGHHHHGHGVYDGGYYGGGYYGNGFYGNGYYGGGFFPTFNSVTVHSARYGTSFTAPLLFPFTPYYGIGYGYNNYGLGPGYGYGYQNTATFVNPNVVVATLPAPNVPVFVPDGNADLVQPAAKPPILNLPNPFAERVPLVDEFPVAALPGNGRGEGNAVDGIQSLRMQSAGDDAFRHGDYVSADAAYRSAIQLTPFRRAPWMRLTWALVAQQRLGDAAASLKHALLLPEDPTRAWIHGDELYGDNAQNIINSHSDVIWNWLNERPGSSDRLLLLAAFQHLRGYSGIAEELQKTARAVGLQRKFEDALSSVLSEDSGQPDRHERRIEKPDEEAAVEPADQAAGAGFSLTIPNE